MHISEAIRRADLIVAAWGRVAGLPAPRFIERAEQVRALLGTRAKCLGRCEDRQPRHPLMLAYDTQLQDL